jgi:hypothetical protein
MSWTKLQFVNKALSAIGYASYVYDLQPEQLDSVLVSLDSMMATWDANGIKIGYPIPSSPQESNLADDSNVPDAANLAIYTNLALIVCPDFGKTAPQELKQNAKSSYTALLTYVVKANLMQFPSTTPAGAGNKTWRRGNRPFLTPPTDKLTANSGNTLDFE